MNTRRIILIAFLLLIVFGIGNFVVNSIQTRSQLGEVASATAATQDDGVQKLIGRGILFDSLQGGAPPETRLNAIASLARLAAGGKNKDIFVQLLQMLKDPDTESAEKKTHPVRDAATAAVATVGPDYPEILMDAAKDQDGAIKAQSISALKKIGKPFEKLLASRLGDSSLRGPFGDILASYGPETIPLIAPYLQPPLLKTDAKPDDLASAKIDLINTLGQFTVPEAATPLLPYASDPDPNVRRAVVTGLASIGAAVGAPVLIAALSDQNTDPSARAAAAAALGAIGTPEANAAMEKALSDYDLSVANAAASGLKRAGDNAGAALTLALASTDPSVRARAASATGGQTSTALAAKALTDPIADVRANAADAMGDVLYRALNPAPAAAPAAGAIAAPASVAPATPVAATSPASAASVAPLVTALADKDGTVAQAAIRALGRLGAAGVAPLVASLSSPDDTVAYYASEALATIGKPAEDEVLAAAAPGKPAARWAAITLGQIGDSRAIPALQALTQSPDADTAYAASSALARVKPG